ncbi:type VI secretion system baseplate subunit TssE [Halarcobacter ebronensis]|uniref:Type VI secretion system baseplate subunit TssE n=1 Tax=Halarcobacter ebronensis TaxID=1462615 RepID=A0A4Q0YE21_9BACT|nr:type VI secretion system baseplate subunit TssE [Halarcobacter ebronensis]RXJ67329.1 type VI secretion system baseplate subunit TssE [Halarcobacter ebronensis]
MKLFKGSLFERLNSEFDYAQYETNEEALYASIANNLSRIFSTNAGSCEIATDYGRPDLNNINLSMKESIEKIEFYCERCIKMYEPRLYKTRVAVSRERLSMNQMNILIEGYLVINGKSRRVDFKADLLKNGKVKIYKDGI